MKKIKIAGAGIAGLTAAINLAKNGYEVEVFEKSSDVEAKRHGDTQHLENWTDDILKYLREINIKLNFDYCGTKKIEFYSPNLNKVVFKRKKPIMYAIKRGPYKGSIDYGLKKQALDSGVRINFNEEVKEKDADIIATGPRRVDATGFGITFKANIPNKIMTIFDDRLAPRAYSYFSAINKDITLTCCAFKTFKHAEEHLKNTIERFERIHELKIENPKKFAGYINFFIPRSAKYKNKLYVGEAAGFQDALAGFGINHAFKSSYLAAKSIIDMEDYDKLWKKGLLAQLKSSFINRYFYEKFDSYIGYDKFVRLMGTTFKRKNAEFLLKRIEGPSLFKSLFFQRALRWVDKEYKHKHIVESPGLV